MLGFTIGKLLLLAAIVAVVWFAFKALARKSAPPPSVDGRNDGVPGAIDTVYDPKTDTYVPRSGQEARKRRD